ncbi:MATE family efflux transporter [Archangium gephyra]|uniref:MATE family efflux transporter n=1 Tax=Archangium gephyra TaxID=48 RepID=UPI0035D3F776
MSPPPAVPTRREEFRELWKLALPIAIAQLGRSLMGFVDTAVLARAGTTSLSAGALSVALLILTTGFGAGLVLGADPLVSQSLGAGNPSRARAYLWQGNYVAVVAGTLLSLAITGSVLLLPRLGVDFVELPEVQDYILWQAPSLPLMLLFINTHTYLQALGRPHVLVVSTVLANLLNLMADILFVFGGAGLPAFFGPLRAVPAMGVKGAALATTLCCALQCAIVLWAVRRIPVSGEKPSRLPDRRILLQILGLGLPIGLHIIADESFLAIVSVLARQLGPESLGAHQLAVSFSIITFAVTMGISNAGSVRVGLAVGAGDLPLTKLRGGVAFVSGALFMGCSGLVFMFFPHALARLIGAPAEVVPLLVPLLMVMAAFQLSDGVMAVGGGVLRGLGETRFTFVANLAGHYLVGLPVGLFLGFGLNHGLQGLWWGVCAGLTAIAACLVWRFTRLTAAPLQPLQAQV